MLGADITLAFDPGRLRVQSISQGELFPAGESTSFYTIDNETGALDYAVTLLGMGNSISGSGILCEIRGQALALGDAPVTITKAELADTSFHLIPVVTSDAVVRVAAGRAYLPMVATSP